MKKKLNEIFDEAKPQELDQFSDVPAEMLPIIEKLQKKSLADQKKLIQIFASMVDIM